MNDWLPSLNALRAFEAVARHKSYKLAANELCVTPAAVKQLVTKLEDVIGEPLLQRHGRGVGLTKAGTQGSGDLASAFRQISLAVDRMRSSNQDKRLVVSVDPAFAAAWLVPRLNSFKAQNPEVEVLIDSSMSIVDIKQGAADIGIRFGVTDHGGLISHRLFDEEISALCSPQLIDPASGPLELKDLAEFNLLRWDLTEFPQADNTRMWNYWKTWLKAVGVENVVPGEGTKFNDYNLAVQAAVAGQGFILGSLPVLRQLIDSNLLVDPFGKIAKPEIGYDIVTYDAGLAREDIQKFVDWTIESANR